MIKKVFVEYKVKKLRPYYTYEEAEGNFYYQFNQSTERFLREIYGQAREAGGAAFKLPESWCRFDVRPGAVSYTHLDVYKRQDAAQSPGF